MKSKLCTFLFIISSMHLQGQVLKLDSIISPNKITPYKNQKLILIDFWATWCAPCLPATKQLEIMQESFPDDVFMISLSDESNSKILQFIQKKPIDLMVVSDYESNNIKRFNVQGRPYAVLLNKKGHLIWEGKPGDLTASIMSRYIKMESYKSYHEKKFDRIFGTQDEYKRKHPKIAKPRIRKIIIEKLGSNKSASYQFTGTLQSFLSEYKAIPKLLFDKNSLLDQEIGVIIPDSINSIYTKAQIADTALSLLGIEESLLEIEMDVYELKVKNPKMLWDTSQISWGKGSPSYLLGDVSLEADNISLKKLASILSNAKDDLYTYKGTDVNTYDFSFIYSDDNMMKTDLENNFGIIVVHKQSKIQVHSFNKKGAIEQQESIQIE